VRIHKVGNVVFPGGEMNAASQTLPEAVHDNGIETINIPEEPEPEIRRIPVAPTGGPQRQYFSPIDVTGLARGVGGCNDGGVTQIAQHRCDATHAHGGAAGAGVEGVNDA